MIGIALEGGAERSSFTAGVIDALMARDFYAAAASGTSAGAGCVLNYRSRQQGVSLEMMIMERHSRYFGIRHMAHTGRFLNLDHMAQEYASRIDWTVYQQFAMQTDFVATCCEDGEPAYLTDDGSRHRLFTAIKASCALPIICEPVELDGKHYVDGSIADPIPFLHLLEQGCDKVIVVLTGSEHARPTDYKKAPHPEKGRRSNILRVTTLIRARPSGARTLGCMTVADRTRLLAVFDRVCSAGKCMHDCVRVTPSR